MSDWREVALGDLCLRVTSGGTPRRSHLDYYARKHEGHSWVKSSELADGYVRLTGERISDSGLENSSAKLLPANSVLVAMYGATAGRVGLLKIEAAVNQAVCALVLDHKRAHPVFVFHVLRSMYHELAGNAAGAAQQNLNAGIVRSFRILAPDYETQCRIAAILSSFDELIEINERRIELLEAVSRSLYREWFVRLRFPGSARVHGADLPEGWQIAPVGDLCQAIRGRSYRRNELSASEGVPFLNLKCVSRGGGLRPDGIKRYTGPFKDSQRAFAGDVLVAVTDMTQERRIVAQAFRMPDLEETFAVLSLDLVLLRPHAHDFRTYLYCCLRYSDFADRVRHFANGANVLHLAVERLLDQPLLVPDERTLARFTATAEQLLAASEFLAHANRRLGFVRDLLLPRLVTGRLDISDIDLGDLLAEADVA